MTRKIILIGAGAIAHHHAAAARLLPDSAIIAIDPNAAARESFAAAYPEATLVEDAKTWLAANPAGTGDIAVIAVPPWLHAEYAIAAFTAGYHVLCEKPLARTLDELAAMLAAADAADRRLGDCAIRFNGLPSQDRVRELLAAGAFGPLNVVRMLHRAPRSRPGVEYQPSSRWFLDKRMSGGGVVMDWSVYDLASLFYVLDPVKVRVNAAFTAGIETAADPEDVPVEVESHIGANMVLTLADGTQVPFVYERANGVHAEPMAQLSIEGRKASVGWQWLPPYVDDAATVTRFIDVNGQLKTEIEKLPMGSHPNFHHLPLIALADAVDGRPSVTPSIARMRFNIALLLAFYQVAETGEPVEIDL